MEKTIEQAIREATGATDAEKFAQMNETAYKIAAKVYELAYLERHKEQPEVDLEKEIESYLDGFIKTPTRTYFRDTIKHFYERGLNARND